MTLSELITECRERLDDLNAPYMWSDAQITRWLNQAVDQAADRSLLIYDESTPSICQIAVTAGTYRYVHDKHVLRVESAYLPGQLHDLFRIVDVTGADVNGVPWRAITNTPTAFATLDNAIYLNPVPNANTTLNIRVRRLPLSTEVMVGSNDEPVIPPEYHLDLIHWALYKAFWKKDADTRSDTDAAAHLKIFEDRFGKKPSARNKQVMRAQRHHGRMHARKFGS